MARLLVHVEGPTEENFVNDVLSLHLYQAGYTSVSARLLGNARQRSHRGGIRPWESVRKDIVDHLAEDPESLATTMVDYYGLPESWPGREEAKRQAALTDKAALIQEALRNDVSDQFDDAFDRGRFVPYVVMHEFEGLLFSDPSKFAQGIGRPELSTQLRYIRNEFTTPEEINDSPDTAPSKRVLALYPRYQKPLMGVRTVQEIGLDAIRRECPLFDGWMRELEGRA